MEQRRRTERAPEGKATQAPLRQRVQLVVERRE